MRNTQGRTRRGNTLIELVAATSIITIALVPALRIMRDALAVEDDMEYARTMSTLCANQLELELAKTAATWATSTDSGNFSSVGYSFIKYSVTRSDSAGSGGITNQLMAITCTVWNDANSNGTLDSGEKSVQFSTKLAKLAAYNS
jgi:hypothetical protein